MSEHAHDTDIEFDLKYLGKNPIKLEPYLHTCIDLKIALEILATIMVQLASRSSLVKKRINIKGEVINTGYVGNIIVMLQNNSENTYIIDPNEKIAQTIFLSLVKRFESTSRIDVPINMAEEKIVDKREIISTCQSISIPSYDQYMVVIERKVKDQVQIFEAEATLCELGEIGLVNLHILAKNHSHIKIPIYNNTKNIMEILEGIIIRYLTTEIEEQSPNPILNFP
ncbi:hypothetical protein G9A89_000963 [Geosiphon pyriformis]|nr:hypothetical protein G9A89_000963 [Geosiphon pyriformis]